MQKSLKHSVNLTFVLLMMVLIFAACKSKQKLAVSPVSADLQISDKPEVSKFTQAEQMAIDNAFLEGVKQMMIEDYGTALGIFLEVLQMDNRHAPANFEVSKIKLMQNESDEAEVYAERASQLSPKNKFYLEHLTRIYQRNSKYPQALTCLQKLNKLEPKNEEYLLEIANIYLMTRKPLEAVKIYDSIEKRQGVTDELSMQKIKIYSALGKEANVRAELKKLIQHFPNETKYRSVLAELNMQDKKYDEAFKEYQNILSIDVEDPYVHLSLADYYGITKDTAKLFDEMVLAIQNPRLDIDSKITLVLPYYPHVNYKKETYEMLDALLSAHPQEAKALALYADFLQRDDRYAEAREKYRDVISVDASRYMIWEALLFCDLNLMDTLELLHDAQSALEHFPEQPLVYYMLGIGYHLGADYAMAMQYFEQGLQLVGTNKRLQMQFYSDLGDVYYQLKNYPKSDENYRKALDIDPQNTLVLNNFAYYLSLRKEHLDEAEKMARLACRKSPNNPTFLDTYAWVLYCQGKYKEAKDIMEMAFRYGGEKEATLLEHYGDILWKTDEKEQALKFWKQAQSMDDKAVSDFLNEKIKTETLIEN